MMPIMHISDYCEHPKLVADEVVSYYHSRNIIPRFYIYNTDSQSDLIFELKLRGFECETLINPVQIWDKQVIDISENNSVTIERVTEKNYQEALDIECSIKEFGGKESIEGVFREQFNNRLFSHYLLRYENQACSTACVFQCGEQARMESVATIEDFRGRGLIGHIIQFIQKDMSARGIHTLWVFPINESIEKVYQKYGFITVDKVKMVHAFLGGRSIQDIQG
ncbi:GNAT family N-acetyltransferase [Terrilactibacillus sp. S3-3]|nr:GNAT family N-acetyltransferase [Terrilactibacillus sp. S3-3]